MDIKELMEFNAGLTDREDLDEGIKYFKESKKLRKLADKISNKMDKLKEKGDVEEKRVKMVEEIIDRTKEASEEFEDLEKRFKEGEIEKEDAKEEHKELTKKYSDLVNRIKSERNKKIFTALGIGSLAATLLATFYGLGIGVAVSKISAGSFALMHKGD